MTPVWGKEYIDLFCDVCLPSMFSEGNIPQSSIDNSITYFVYIIRHDYAYLKAKKSIQKLSDYTNVKYVFIDEESLGNENAYVQMNNCHIDMIDKAMQSRDCVVFITPDQIFSKGSIGYITESMNKDIALMLVAGLRLNKDAVVLELDRYREDGVVALTDKELNSIALRNLHSGSKGLFFDYENISDWPAHLYFNVDNGFVLHGFHLHPTAINTAYVNDLPSHTIDFDYVDQFDHIRDKVLIVRDSERLCTHEISSEFKEEVAKDLFVEDKCLSVAYWAYQYAYSIHRYFFDNPILFRTEEKIQAYGHKDDEVSRIKYWLDVYEGIAPRNLSQIRSKKIVDIVEISKKYEAELVECINRVSEVILSSDAMSIWGAGSTGRYFCEILDGEDVCVTHFYDSQEREEIDGREVYAYCQEASGSHSSALAITCGMSEYLAEMRDIKRGIQNRDTIFLTKLQAWRPFLRSLGLDDYYIVLIINGYLSGKEKRLYQGELIEVMLAAMFREGMIESA